MLLHCIPVLVTILLLACGLEDVSAIDEGDAVRTLLVAAAVATVVKAFLRNENWATDDFPLSNGISKSISSKYMHYLLITLGGFHQ